MTTVHWIAFVIGLMILAFVTWLVLTLLWLTGKIAQHIAFREWGIRRNLLRWTIGAALLAILASFSGFSVSELPVPLRGAADEAIRAYRRDVTIESLQTIIYGVALMAVHVVWSYIGLVLGLMTGKYPVKQERGE
jgi:hypothetical protein